MPRIHTSDTNHRYKRPICCSFFFCRRSSCCCCCCHLPAAMPVGLSRQLLTSSAHEIRCTTLFPPRFCLRRLMPHAVQPHTDTDSRTHTYTGFSLNISMYFALTYKPSRVVKGSQCVRNDIHQQVSLGITVNEYNSLTFR